MLRELRNLVSERAALSRRKVSLSGRTGETDEERKPYLITPFTLHRDNLRSEVLEVLALDRDRRPQTCDDFGRLGGLDRSAWLRRRRVSTGFIRNGEKERTTRFRRVRVQENRALDGDWVWGASAREEQSARERQTNAL